MRGRTTAPLEVFIQLTRAAERIAGELQPALAEQRLTAGQLGVLQSIAENGPSSLRELGGRLFRSGPNMTIVVDNLERAGLVRRHRSAADRRVVLVEATAEGMNRVRSAYPAYVRGISRFVGALSPAEQERLTRLCQKLLTRPDRRTNKSHEGHGFVEVNAEGPRRGRPGA